MRWLPRSISLRLTVAFSGIALFVFAAAGILLHHALSREFAQAGHAELRGKIDLVQHHIEEARPTRDMATLLHRLDDMLIGRKELRVWVQSSDGTVDYGGLPATVIERLGAPGHLRILGADGVTMDAIDATLSDTAPLPPFKVRVAIDSRPRDKLLLTYRNIVVVVCLVGVLLTIGLSAVATWYDLAPIKRLSVEATKIRPNALSLRLSNKDVDEELQGLVSTFNTVLDRLEGAYRQMEAFNADVAHELRTPLATLISGTQLVLSNDAPPAELRETLASNLEDLEQLRDLVNDMLFLARADQGDRAQGLEHADLAAEADKMIEYYEPVLAEAQVDAVREGSGSALCNPALIRRALANLLSNAIKHTSPGQRIVVRLESTRGRVRVSVFNPGVPIAPQVAARMFDRFYRADEVRARVGESHGLGLAIVRAIASMHGGSVFVEPQSGGNSVGLELSNIAWY